MSITKKSAKAKSPKAKLGSSTLRTAICQEERTMAKTNNGRITAAEQKALNQQENQISR
jgi:hypothetical protein